MREGFSEPGMEHTEPTRAEQREKERAEREENLTKSIETEPARYLSAETLQLLGSDTLYRALEKIEQTGDKVALDEEALSKLIAAIEKWDYEEGEELVGRIKKVTGTESADYKFPRKIQERLQREMNNSNRTLESQKTYAELLRQAEAELGQSESKDR